MQGASAGHVLLIMISDIRKWTTAYPHVPSSQRAANVDLRSTVAGLLHVYVFT